MSSALVPLTLASAVAGPNGASVVGGSATVQGQGTANVVVNQTSNSAIINWNTFNIGAGETTRINMPSASSTELDRVTGGLGPSQILGSLSSNGQVFLVNPDGILFGAGSRVNVGGLLATTNNISNSNFMAGNYSFSIPGMPNASIVNAGSITAQTGGFAALVAPGVRNTGTITAKLGTVALASGNTFTLDLYGDNLITLGVNDSIASQVIDVSTGQPLSSLVSNAGTLKANGGTVVLTAVAARQVVDSVISSTGVIEANTIGTHKGMIVLAGATAANTPASAPAQTVKVSGTLSAAGKRKGTKGGIIVVTGGNVQLKGATINASGKAGGGAVLIGGDWGGGHPNTTLVSNLSAYLEPFAVPTATTVSIDASTTINASATNAGNGGKVVVWSNEATTFYGIILATGGANGGNGGFVETSSHQVLTYNGAINTSAAHGQLGTALLDPGSVSIDANAGTGIITVASIESGLQSGNFIVSTGTGSGSIAVDSNVNLTWANASTLTLSAFGSIDFQAGALISNTGSGNLILRADNTGTGIGAVTFGSTNQINFSGSTGTVSIFYNPLDNPAGSVVNVTSYTSPTDYTPYVLTNSAVPNQLTAYMLVNTVYDLQNIENNLSGTYALGTNIDATATASWNSGAGFVPIGNANTPFTGTFNGGGNTISNPTINLPSSTYVGLFGLVGAYTGTSNGLVENVGVVGGSVIGNFEVGGLAGGIFGTVTNSYATDAVNGNSYVGGLIGGSSGSVIQSYATGTVTGNSGSSLVGGLIGANGNGTVIQSYAIGMVIGGSGSSFVGGLIGGNGGTVTSSYWNTQTSGRTVSDGGTGLTTAQFQAGLPSGFDPAVWSSAAGVNSGYPCLLAQASCSFTPRPSTPSTPSAPPVIPQLPPAQQQIATNLAGTVMLASLTPDDVISVQALNQLQALNQAQALNQSQALNQLGAAPGPNGLPPQFGKRFFVTPPLTETRYVKNEVVLHIPASIPAAEVQAMLGRLRLTVLDTENLGVLGVTAYRVRFATGSTASSVIQALSAFRIVAGAQANYIYSLTQDATSAAARTEEGDTAQYVLPKWGVPDIHRFLKGTGIKIAVIDSEIDVKNPELDGVIADHYDAVGHTEQPDAHGTGMAGAIAAHGRLMGIAPSARLYAVHAFSPGAGTAESTSFNILKGLDHAVTNGVRVINMSFTGPRDTSMERVLHVAHDQGIVLIAAAGNDGPRSRPDYPGAFADVIAVTATDVNDKVFAGANRGPYIAVAAPGVDILVPAPADAYQLTTGTSVASAEVSGIVALLLQRNPNLTPNDIRSILTSSARHPGTKQRDDDYGSGLVDPPKAIQSTDEVKPSASRLDGAPAAQIAGQSNLHN
jgi:filamentous hemagglutinin family protein